MATQDEVQPVNHGFGSAAAIAAAETGKGFFRGAGGGMWRGALIGALVTAAVPVLGLALFGAGLTTLAVVGGLAAIPGLFIGSAIGAPTGAVAGTLKGLGDGAERVARDRGAAQIARTQETAASAQVETAKALQSKVIERMSVPQVAAPAPEQPQPTVCEADYKGQGVASVQPEQAAGFAARIQQQQQAQAAAEQQVG